MKSIVMFLLIFQVLSVRAAQDKVTLTGSSTIAPMVSDFGKAFEANHPGIRIDVQSGGSGRGITDARQGLADLGMVSRFAKDDEKDLKFFTIALDGVCIILNKANKLESLSEQQVIDIYTGKITNWKEIGGKDAKITVVNKAEGRSTLELFTHHFKLKNSEIKASVVIGDNQQGIKTVAGNPNAIGYVSVGSAEYDSKHGVKIKLLPMKGVLASTENILNRTFPLSRPLNLVAKSEPEGVVKEFLQFVLSKDANAIIKDQFFVPLAK